MGTARSKEDAELMLMKERDKMAKKFCPMAQRTCVRSCVCYEPGRLADPVRPDGSCIYYSPFCNHPFVEGNLVVIVET